jgi:hypothetical protein
LLARLFDTDSVAKEYYVSDFDGWLALDFESALELFHEDLDGEINYLESVLERLDIIPELENIKTASP